MTAATKQQPVIQFTKGTVMNGRLYAFHCTCRARLGGFKTEKAVTAAAQRHSDWHWTRGEHSLIELGGLL